MAHRGCSFDAFDDVVLHEAHAARTERHAYTEARYSDPSPLSGLSASHRRSFHAVLFEELAGIAKAVLECDRVFLFNEHFVVKPPRSRVRQTCVDVVCGRPF